MNFPQTVWTYYREHGRNFSWREEITPYKVLVSEIMLQQTQTGRITERFPRFLKRFPSLQDLAAASLSEVLGEWQGLGYNRRGKYLHEAARAIESSFEGEVPADPEVLRILPGLGAYTSASIPCFAYNVPTTFIETNIRTVYLHHFFPEAREVSDKDILPLIERDVDKTNPREWYYALMDYGAHLKATTPSRNAQSRHYRRQSKFAGSNRQVRAGILKQVLLAPQTLTQLRTAFPATETRLEANLQALLQEGLLARRGELYRISE